MNLGGCGPKQNQDASTAMSRHMSGEQKHARTPRNESQSCQLNQGPLTEAEDEAIELVQTFHDHDETKSCSNGLQQGFSHGSRDGGALPWTLCVGCRLNPKHTLNGLVTTLISSFMRLGTCP